MSSASAAADALPQLPPAIPVGLEAALGVSMPESDPDARVVDLSAIPADSDGLVLRDNDVASLEALTMQMVTDAANRRLHPQMSMPAFWHAIAEQTDLESPAQARLVVSTALRLATEQARDHGSFRMGPYVRFTRVARGTPGSGSASSVELTPLAKVHQYAQP